MCPRPPCVRYPQWRDSPGWNKCAPICVKLSKNSGAIIPGLESDLVHSMSTRICSLCLALVHTLLVTRLKAASLLLLPCQFWERNYELCGFRVCWSTQCQRRYKFWEFRVGWNFELTWMEALTEEGHDYINWYISARAAASSAGSWTRGWRRLLSWARTVEWQVWGQRPGWEADWGWCSRGAGLWWTSVIVSRGEILSLV